MLGIGSKATQAAALRSRLGHPVRHLPASRYVIVDRALIGHRRESNPGACRLETTIP